MHAHNLVQFLPSCAVAPEPRCLFIEQTGPTSIQAYWVIPRHSSGSNSYRITYRGGSSGYVNIDDGLTSSVVITGLKNGANYTMSIITISPVSDHLPSIQTESNFLQLGMYILQFSAIVYTHYCMNITQNNTYGVYNSFFNTHVVFYGVSVFQFQEFLKYDSALLLQTLSPCHGLHLLVQW